MCCVCFSVGLCVVTLSLSYCLPRQLQYEVMRLPGDTEEVVKARLLEQLKEMFSYASAGGEEDQLLGNHHIYDLGRLRAPEDVVAPVAPVAPVPPVAAGAGAGAAVATAAHSTYA